MSKIGTKGESIKRLLYKPLKTYTSSHVYIYMGEKIHNFSSPHMSHRELFRSKPKKEIKSPNSKKERISYHIMLLNN